MQAYCSCNICTVPSGVALAGAATVSDAASAALPASSWDRCASCAALTTAAAAPLATRAVFLAAFVATSVTPDPAGGNPLTVGAGAAAAVKLTAAPCATSEEVSGAELATRCCSSASFKIMKPRTITCSACAQVHLSSSEQVHEVWPTQLALRP